jgi:hypothetical protein
MSNIYGIVAIILYMMANGLLNIFQMYKNTNDKDLTKNYNNKVIKKLAGVSGYLIIILLLVIFNIYGIIITIIVFLLGFLGKNFFNIIDHYLIVLPINKLLNNK